MSPGLPAKDSEALEFGRVIAGRYRIEQALGTGGMGAVYRATHVHMRKTVALKVLHKSMTRMPEAVARFQREAVAAARIQHPNVASAIDFGRLDDDTYYLSLEFVEGRNLRQVLHRAGGSISVERALSIASQLTAALVAAHSHDIVHRDLKPENIMVQEQGPEPDSIKVLDFGLAKVAFDDDADGDPATQLTKMGTIFGTPTYMSPEQASAGVVGPSSDLYSLGVLLYEMLDGKPPFAADTVLVLLNKHLNEAPPPLPRHVSPRLARLVMRLLEKKPEARPASAQEVQDELHTLRSGLAARAADDATKFWRAAVHFVAHTWARVYSKLAALGRHVARRFGPVSARTFAALERRIPALAVLRRPLAFGRHRVRLGVLLAGAGVVLGVMVGAGLLVGAEDAPSVEMAPAAALEAPETNDSQGAVLESPLSSEEADQLTDIEALPVYKRKLADWLSLGALHAKAGDWSKSTSAYRNAIQLDPAQAKDPEVLGAIRIAAEQRTSYEAAITLAMNLLGEPGVDLLFDLWTSLESRRHEAAIRELAEQRLRILRVNHASDALQVRLELEFAKPADCESLQRLLKRATRWADQRSSAALASLRDDALCTRGGSSRCESCAGGADDLQAAIDEANTRSGPTFSEGRYVPGR